MSSTSEKSRNFLRGHPNVDHLPTNLIKNASNIVNARLAGTTKETQEDRRLTLNYQENEGDYRFRSLWTDYLNKNLAISADNHIKADQLFLSAGASFAIDSIIRTRKISSLEEPPIFIMEKPSYFLVAEIFQNYGFQRFEVPMRTDDNVIDLDALERAFQQGGALYNKRVDFLYTVPIHHNPCASTLSSQDRKRLLALSKTYQFAIIADEVYTLLTFSSHVDAFRENQLSWPLAVLDYEPFSVYSVGSFAKTLAPSFRFGYVFSRDLSMLKKLATPGYLTSGGSLINGYTLQMFVEALKNGDFDRHLQSLQRIYQQQGEKVCEILEKYFPQAGTSPILKFTRPKGGYFMWLTMHKDIPAEKVFDTFKENNLIVLKGTRCSDDLTHSFRICFVYLDAKDLFQGIECICQIINQFGSKIHQ